MKRRILRHTFVLGLVAALALASCSQNELADGGQGTPLPAGKYPLMLTASIGEAAATPATRSTVDNQWNKEKVYVQIAKWGGPGSVMWNNSKRQSYNVSGSGEMDRTEGNDVFWEESDEEKAIRAWCVPKDSESHGNLPSSHTVEADQSGVGYAQSDYLYAGCISGFAEGKNGVNLRFYHQVAKLKVQIIRSEDTPADFSVTGLTINSVATQGTYTAPEISENDDNNRYGTWSDTGEVENITPHEANDKDGQADDNILATYEAIVIPQTVNHNTKLFTITAEGYNSFAYTITESNVWEPGREYTYTITVKGDKLDVNLSEGNIGWSTDGATGSGKVKLP